MAGAPPRLTIGLPVYNGENFLSEALDTLLAQTYTDFELIISDNASTDGTEEICRRYARSDPRIRYLRQERNIGLVPNHNFLVGQARGEYFKWAGHDDRFAPELVERCIEILDERPHVVLCHADMAIIDMKMPVRTTRRVGQRTVSPAADCVAETPAITGGSVTSTALTRAPGPGSPARGPDLSCRRRSGRGRT